MDGQTSSYPTKELLAPTPTGTGSTGCLPDPALPGGFPVEDTKALGHWAGGGLYALCPISMEFFFLIAQATDDFYEHLNEAGVFKIKVRSSFLLFYFYSQK